MKKKLAILATAACLISGGAIASAGDLIDQVSGKLRGDVAVQINGDTTQMHPVIIDGKSYLPVRDMADALGYSIKWNEAGLQLQVNDRQEGNGQTPGEEQEEAKAITIGGVISQVSYEDGQARFEVIGHGLNNWMILFADSKSTIVDDSGKAIPASELKAGMRITADYGPIVALSYPGQSHASSIIVESTAEVKESKITHIEDGEDGWWIGLGDAGFTLLSLQSGKETLLVNKQAQPVSWDQLEVGMNVRAFYGPAMTKSLPPQSAAHVIVVLDDVLTDAEIKQFVEEAKSIMSESDLKSLTADKVDARLSQVKSGSISPVDDEAKTALKELEEAKKAAVHLNFSTDDKALGPIVMVFHPDTHAYLGQYFRR